MGAGSDAKLSGPRGFVIGVATEIALLLWLVVAASWSGNNRWS